MKRKRNSQKTFQLIGHGIMLFWVFLCIIPFLLLLSSSFSDEESIILYGYKLLPKELSIEAYRYLIQEWKQILRAYGNTFIVTGVGTFFGLAFTHALAYGLSRKDLPARNFFNFYVFFTMLFNGGLVPTYIMYTRYLHIKNTIWAFIIPALLINAFNVMITRTYLQGNIPEELIEAARIDGAGEIKTYKSIVFPMSKPILATIGLFIGLAYWNDWMNGMYFVTETKLFTLQNLLNSILSEAQFLASNSDATSGQIMVASIPTNTVKMAIAVIAVVPILIVYPFVQKYFVKGIAIGSVKG